MDQPGRPQLRQRTTHGAARRGLRRRHLLRDVQRRAPSQDRGPRLRRPGVPHERWRAGLRRAAGHVRRTGCRRGRGHLGAQPVSRHVRTRARRAGADVGRGRAGRDVRPGRSAAGAAPGDQDAGGTGVLASHRPTGVVGAADVGRRWTGGAPTAASRRGRRPGLDRRLPGPPRVRGAAAGDRAGSGGDPPRDHRREAPGSRRRRVPDRGEVEGRGRAARAPALLHLQRRRVRTGHVQGPRRDGEPTRTR